MKQKTLETRVEDCNKRVHLSGDIYYCTQTEYCKNKIKTDNYFYCRKQTK